MLGEVRVVLTKHLLGRLRTERCREANVHTIPGDRKRTDGGQTVPCKSHNTRRIRHFTDHEGRWEYEEELGICKAQVDVKLPTSITI